MMFGSEGISMRKTYEKAELWLIPAEAADLLTVSMASSNGLELVEDGNSFSHLFPIV